MKALAAVSTVIAILFASLYFSQNESLDELGKVVLEREELQKQVKQFSESELDEYLKLNDQKKRYQKADELLGKVMLLFLANLGLNVSDEKKEKLEDMAQAISIGENPETVVIADPYKDLRQNQCEPCPSCPVCSTSVEPVVKKNDVKAVKLLNFADKFKQVKIRQLIDQDIYSQLWKSIQFDFPTRNILLGHAQGYPGTYKGYFRSAHDQSDIEVIVENEIREGSVDENVYFDFKLMPKRLAEDGPFITLVDSFLVSHPANHGHDPDRIGPCRGLVMDTDQLKIVLMRLRYGQQFTLLGKVYSKKKEKKKKKPEIEHLGNLVLYYQKGTRPAYGRD